MSLAKKIENYFIEAKNKTDEVRESAALEIRELFEETYTDLATDAQVKLTSTITDSLQKLFRSSEINDKKTAFILLQHLVDLEINDFGIKLQCLREITGFIPTSESILMELNVNLLIKYVQNSLLTSDNFDLEMKKAKIYLNDDSTDRKAYVLILFRECSRQIPTLFFPYIFDLFPNFCACLNDQKALIRETSLSLIKNCLNVFVPRENRVPSILRCYEALYKSVSISLSMEASKITDEILNAFMSALHEIVRICSGATQQIADELTRSYKSEIEMKDNLKMKPYTKPRLTSSALLKRPSFNETISFSIPPQSSECLKIIRKNYSNLQEILFKHCQHKNLNIAQLGVSIIALLSGVNSTIFSNSYLNNFVHLVFSLLNLSRERESLFISLAVVTCELKEAMSPYVNKILKFIAGIIPDVKSGKKLSQSVEPALVGLLSCFTVYDKDKHLLHHIIKNIIEYSRLTPAVVTLLVRCGDSIEDSQSLILSLVNIVSSSILRKYTQENLEENDAKLIVLALRTIRVLEILDYQINDDLYKCSQIYLTSTNKIVRLEAAKTCCQLISVMPKNNSGSIYLSFNDDKFSHRVFSTLKRLVIVGVSDPESDIRFCVLSSLSEYNIEQLASTELLKILSSGIRDECVSIRSVIIDILGGLSIKNPAYIIPILDQHVVECLTYLNSEKLVNCGHESCHLLCYLVASTPRVAFACMDPVMETLLPLLNKKKLCDDTIASLLAAISDLSFYCGKDMIKHMPKFIETTQTFLTTGSIEKKEFAMECLVNTIRHTGYFVDSDFIYVSLVECLSNLMSAKQGRNIRRAAIKAFGVLGARDPYIFKTRNQRSSSDTQEFIVRSWEESLSSANVFELLQHYTSISRLEEFYAGVVITIMLKVLSDPSLNAYHSLAVQVVENICVSLSAQCHKFLSLIFPTYFRVVRICDLDMQRVLLDQIGKLIPLAKIRALPYVEELYKLIDEHWSVSTQLSIQMKVIKIVQFLLCYLPEDASKRLSRVVSRLVDMFLEPLQSHNPAEFNQFAMIFLTAIQHMAPFLRDHLFIIIPALIRGFDNPNRCVELRKLAISTLKTLFFSNDLHDYVGAVIQPLLRGFSDDSGLISELKNLLQTLFEYAPSSMKVFIPLIMRTLKNQCVDIEDLISYVSRCSEHQLEIEALGRMNRYISGLHSKKRDEIDYSSQTPRPLNSGNIVRACQTSQRVSKEDWDDWLNLLSLELVKEAPSSAIRTCSLISQTYGDVGHQLFAFAFFSCWRELNHDTRESLVNSFTQALISSDATTVSPTILGLAEFMEHTNCDPLPLKPLELAACANNTSSYAKALRYTEIALNERDDIDVLQSLISLNTLVNNYDAAQGVLFYASRKNLVDLTLQQRWLEKLHDWKHALEAYEKQLELQPQNTDLIYGKMQCLEALCEWNELDKLLSDQWTLANDIQKPKLAIMGSLCSIGLGQWNSLKIYVNSIPKQSLESSFFKAVNEIRSGRLASAKLLLEGAWSILENDFFGTFIESYEQNYRSLLTCQMLSELDEVINYQLFPAQRLRIEFLWEQRFRSCKRVVSDWHRMLDIRAVVLEPRDNIASWLKLSELCRREGSHSLCQNIFSRILTENELGILKTGNLPDIHPMVAYHYVKHLWASGKQSEGFSLLNLLVTRVLPSRLASKPKDEVLSRIMSKAHLQLGLWTMSGVLGPEDVSLARENFVAATEHGKTWYKAWNEWAKINYEVVMRYRHHSSLPENMTSDIETNPVQAVHHVVTTYVLPAIRALFRSAQLSEKNSFQDTLRLLTLWFDYGDFQEVGEAIEAGLVGVKLETWLQVVPQLIARIDTPKVTVRLMIQQLLIRLGTKHPQALVYPLMVSVKSLNDVRTLTVSQILKSLSEHFPGLVEQAELIRTELIRVSILWCEAVCIAIDDASRLFFNDKDIPATLKILDSLHSILENGPQTPCEISFFQTYGESLQSALRFRKFYTKSSDIRDLLQAWSVYYRIYRRLLRQTSQIKSVDIQFASPRLFQSRDLILPVPGTYHPNSPVICIHKVDPLLKVIGSKQKPRRLTIRGNNGQRYDFLLKGHEDLRQDERVMQLFGLLNNLLINRQTTFNRRLEICRYVVVPLSTESGLIGWVPNTDTLHSLIKEYRTSKGISPSSENVLLSKCSPRYETLDLIHKVETFEYVLQSTPDDHLSSSLWLKSANSETWLEKRTNFTRSLALMSMIGYILGLGDRHPSNIMQDQNSGRIVHIDFGDCFEVAMRREKFPERVPFRLTRMLSKCMEVTGIDGTFKVTSFHVMELLREHKDSLLAVLEAFVHDPLLNWRLLESKNVETPQTPSQIDINLEESSENFLKSLSLHASSLTNISHLTSKHENSNTPPQVLKNVAIGVIKRVIDKLSGTDFEGYSVVDVKTQVDLLIDQATSIENLAQSYIGWSPFW